MKQLEKSHEALLRDILRDVYAFGVARIPNPLLYRWFKAQKISKNTWRYFVEMWDEILEENEDTREWRLAFIDTGRTDELALVCLDPEGTKVSYIRPLSEKC